MDKSDTSIQPETPEGPTVRQANIVFPAAEGRGTSLDGDLAPAGPFSALQEPPAMAELQLG